MIALAPYFLLIPFGLFLVGYVFLSFVNIVNLFRYGSGNLVDLVATFVFLAVSAGILFGAWLALADVDWTTPIPLLATTEAFFMQ